MSHWCAAGLVEARRASRSASGGASGGAPRSASTAILLDTNNVEETENGGGGRVWWRRLESGPAGATSAYGGRGCAEGCSGRRQQIAPCPLPKPRGRGEAATRLGRGVAEHTRRIRPTRCSAVSAGATIVRHSAFECTRCACAGCVVFAHRRAVYVPRRHGYAGPLPGVTAFVRRQCWLLQPKLGLK